MGSFPESIDTSLLRRYPDAILFLIEAGQTLTVLACFHGSRDPANWQRRI
jgi:hypothetical protein